jgi:histidine triad (HIT) family protein
MTQCLFCKFVRQELPTREVYRDEEVLAFEDINPQAPHHVLLIPTAHVASVSELGPEHQAAMGKLWLVAQHIAKERGLDEGGYRLVTNTGPDAGQTVFHLHVHLLGGRSFRWPPG